jgi:hypothetical protein
MGVEAAAPPEVSELIRRAYGKTSVQFPQLSPSPWRGEILVGGSANFGQVAQPGSPRQSFEFHFTLEEEAGGSWPVRSWGMGIGLT